MRNQEQFMKEMIFKLSLKVRGIFPGAILKIKVLVQGKSMGKSV